MPGAVPGFGDTILVRRPARPLGGLTTWWGRRKWGSGHCQGGERGGKGQSVTPRVPGILGGQGVALRKSCSSAGVNG